MGAHFLRDQSGIWELHISGTLKKAELDAAQAAGSKALASGGEARLLITLEDTFSGWGKGEAWGDTTFFSDHGDQIVKIAVLGDRPWEEEMLMFLGAGLRRAPVRYFPRAAREAALEWLA